MDDLFLISSAAFTKYLAAVGVFGELAKNLYIYLATYFFRWSTIFVITCLNFQRVECVFAQVLKNEEYSKMKSDGEEFRIYVFCFKQ